MLKKWEIAKVDKLLAKELAEECDIDPFVALIAASRGYTDAESLEELLSEEGLFADIYELPDLKNAAEIINRSIDNNETIAIYGDYDCDGVCASAILYLYLQSRGVNPICYIPDRINEGYGMSVEAIDTLKKQNVSLIITVDNGISCGAEIDYAKSIGIDVVVTDHHLPPNNLPLASAVVDPHLPQSNCFCKDICGAAVAFKLICALENSEPEEQIFYYGDLVAIATIGDVMPLVYENRAIVKNGIISLKQNLRPGIVALLDICGISVDDIDEGKIAYAIVPRINAAGRMGSAYRAFELLVTDNNSKAESLAQEIFNENINRQQIEKDIFIQAVNMVEKSHLNRNKVIVVCGENWHLGVIGIVASKLCDKYNRPSIVLSSDGQLAFGSGRSINGFSLYEAINRCSECLEKFGGHELAAGITIKAENIGFFCELINKIANEFPPFFSNIYLECKLNPAVLSTELVESLSVLRPFGHGNPVPLFAVCGVRIEKISSIGNNKHIKLLFTKSETSFQAVKFSVTEESFAFSVGDVVDIAVQLDINIYNGKEYLSVIIKDIKMNGTDDLLNLESIDLFNSFKNGFSSSVSLLIPTREEFAMIYKYVAVKQADLTALCYRFAPNICFGKVMVIVEALLQLGLVKEETVQERIVYKLVEHHARVELNDAPILKELLEKKG